MHTSGIRPVLRGVIGPRASGPSSGVSPSRVATHSTMVFATTRWRVSGERGETAA
jgi:hypothetical protein